MRRFFKVLASKTMLGSLGLAVTRLAENPTDRSTQIQAVFILLTGFGVRDAIDKAARGDAK